MSNSITSLLFSVATVRTLQQVRPTYSPTTCCSSGLWDQILQRCALCTGFTSRIPPPANHGPPGLMHVNIAKNYFQLAGICDKRFAAVNQKKRDNNLAIYKNMPTVVGSGQDSSSLSVTSKKPELKSMIISRISPHISASDSENFTYGYLKLL